MPTLILSGAQDLRTPTSGARAVAALIPDAQLLVVPFTGHSVLGSDFSGCAQAAVTAFFAGAPVQPCTPAPNVFAPTPVTPRRLAYMHPPPGLRGRPGRTLAAVLDTLVDLNRQVIGATLQADAELPSGSSFGGLRGGYARLTASAACCSGFSFVTRRRAERDVPGATTASCSRRRSASPARSAARGTVTARSAAKRVSGTLGGKRFDVSLAQREARARRRRRRMAVAPGRLPLPGWPNARPLR